MSNCRWNRSALALPVFVLGVSLAGAAQADRYRTTQHDFGGVGLLQTPTARMAPDGAFSFNANRTEPYSRYSLSFQPLPWLESSIRYIAITNREYGVSQTGQSLKDKAIDAKFRLWEEGYYAPQIALGFRDLGGTGLFSSEYVVANKRFWDLDLSLGMAWGYIGNRGDASNPLGQIGLRSNSRQGSTGPVGGDFNIDSFFSGPVGFFGGVEYQTPWDRLRLKMEVEGNDYQSEPQRNNQAQDSPVNLGAVFRLADSVDITTAWERGNTVMFGITLHTNLKTGTMPAKILDPAPEPRVALPPGVSGQQVDWQSVSARLQDNAGFAVEQIAVRDRELIVTGEQTTYRDEARSAGRAARVLDNATGEGSFDWYTLVNKNRGMEVSEISLRPDRLRWYETNQIGREELRRSTVHTAPSRVVSEVLHQEPLDRLSYGVGLGYNQNVGGPDSFILYQFLARATAEYRFDRNKWVRGSVGVDLINNFDEFTYDGPSELPRVRTDIREYLTSSDVVLENLQYTQTLRLDRDLYAMGYAGLLENMFGGVGGELLYRPFDSPWALGVDANWVKQRGYRQDFSFRDYSVLTGHVTGYLQTGFYDVLAKGSVGRYLARDYGATLDLSRRFANGIVMGAWATRTNVSAEEFGEGSFDKGIYFTFPFDAFFARSTRSSGTISWNPLTRDGGARLARYYQLYDMTDSRDASRFDNGFSRILE